MVVKTGYSSRGLINKLDKYIGKVYNQYTIIEYSHTQGTHPIYKCRCSCGAERNVYLCNLISGHSKSCGCSRRKKMYPGSKYGRWTVIDFAGIRGSKQTAYWNCVCECGTKKAVNGAMLRNGLSTSCGCYASEQRLKACTKHNLCGTKKYRQWECRHRREMKRIYDSQWTPEMELALRNFQKRCVLCGITEKEQQEKHGKSLAVDHVHPLSSGNGLVPGNAVILCNNCNSSKGSKILKDLDQYTQLKLNVNANMFKLLYEGNFLGI